jgi:dynein heavy chain
LYSFDLDTQSWEKIESANNPPEARGGHTLFSIGRKIYSYGGWNSENQFNNIVVFNLDTNEWYDPDIYNDIPRWNHCAIMVEAIPSWKYFIFGGETGDFPEGGPRHFGHCTNSACFLDIETMHWTNLQPEDIDNSKKPLMPNAREYSAMAYDYKDSRLLVFGGWNNGWFNDLHALNVSKIVGPSYAITEIVPGLGQLSGNV